VSDDKMSGWRLIGVWLAMGAFSAACWYGVFELVSAVLS